MSLHGINEACYYSRHDTHQNLGKHQLTIGMMKRHFFSCGVVVVDVVVVVLPGTIVVNVLQRKEKFAHFRPTDLQEAGTQLTLNVGAAVTGAGAAVQPFPSHL